jgi:hypothetical protein
MTFEELKAALEAAGKGELVDNALALIDAEKQKGISATNKKNQENAKLRAFKNAAESLGYTEGDVDEWAAGLITKVNKETTSNNSPTVKALNDQLASLKSALDNEKKARTEAESRAKNKSISAKLSEVLADKVYGHDLLIKSLISDGKVDLDGENVVFVNGDDRIDFNNGLKSLLESRKDIAKTVQNPGTGKVENKNIPANLEAIIKSGDMNTIKANLDQIKQSYGIK